MGYVRMSDLGQVMMATGGGGGGGGGLARQATQARGYVMPGHTPPVSQPSISMPVSTPSIATPAPTPTGGSSISIATPGGGTPPPARTTITTTTTTPPPQPTFTAVPYVPQHTIVFIEGASDPYNEFGASAVDDGSEAQSLEPESKSEYVDPFDQKKEENKGPFNVFKIEDDPTLNDLTPQERQSVEEIRESDRLTGLAVGVVLGTAVGVAACKLWSWWRRAA